MPHIRAELLFRRKYVYADGAIVEMKVWAVPKAPRTPEGFKYSMVYIDDHGDRILGYDNAEGKGHHRHERRTETPFQFETIDALTEIFLQEVREIRDSRP